MESSFTDLRRLLDLWATWYSIGIDGWLATDESSHTCSLDLPNPADPNSSLSAQPPYPPDSELDALLLRALNQFGLQCSRLGAISFSRTGVSKDFISAGDPIIALLEGEQAFFSGKQLSLFSELRRDYGDFGSHTMALDLAVQDGHTIIRRSSFETNNRRRGLKLDLWEPITNALAAYEELYEQGAALGHSFTDDPADLASLDQKTGDSLDERQNNNRSETTKLKARQEQPSQAEQSNHQQEFSGLPFPCLNPAEASHVARLSNQVAPTRHAVAEGSILLSTHPLRELAALITFARFCEPLGAVQRM
ncbi:MAG TPA: hypothetical protein VKR06_25225 [Ktedonosporobacter sp.]|nr:hypothetical protein [Ktedonosporobacter sp.]